MKTLKLGRASADDAFVDSNRQRNKRSTAEMMRLIVRMQLLLREERGQDLIEYALMAGFVAVAAGAFMPGISTSISTVFSKVGSVMTAAGG
jgi:pilus assembly protein Flp/PilA